MVVIDKNRPVCVTGASGYIAGWIVKELLDQGLTVHATVRDLNKASSVGHLWKPLCDHFAQMIEDGLLKRR